ncbi:MAG: hypothetical protein IKH88_09095 [Prevotella sp.]|nr:hypothetical protein [Prevotella sp.]
MKKIVILYPIRHNDYGFYSDLIHKENVKLVSLKRNPYSFLLKNLKLGKGIKALVLYLLRIVKYLLDKIIIDLGNIDFYSLPYKTKNVKVILVMDFALNAMDNFNVLNKCKKNKDIKICLYLINQIGFGDAENREDVQKLLQKMNSFKWDSIFSFDKHDCEKFGFQYMGFNYYSMRNLKSVSNPSKDLFLAVCYSKSREKIICDVYSYLAKAGVKCDIHVKLWNEGYENMIDGIHYITKGFAMMTYEECLKKALDSNCLLEIIRPGQEGPTLRYMEAVCYNKKLLTNNSQITEYPFYNPQYMKIFDKVEDIDIEWLTDKSPVEYYYKGDFSPVHLVDELLCN